MELGIDVDDIEKGMVIPDATMRRILGEFEDEDDYRLARLEFRGRLSKALESAGKLFTLRFVRDDLHVLNDAAASKHNRRTFKNKRRGMSRSNRLLEAVDTRNLSADQRVEHDRGLLYQGAILSAVDRASRELPRVVATRATPAVRVERAQRVI